MPQLEEVTIDGQQGVLAYFNKDFVMVDQKDATMAKVVFDDGRVVFYTVEPITS